jgi:hypothetical protein
VQAAALLSTSLLQSSLVDVDGPLSSMVSTVCYIESRTSSAKTWDRSAIPGAVTRWAASN